MHEQIILDSGPIGRLARKQLLAEDRNRFELLLRTSGKIYLSDVVDFEIRRSFILHKLSDSLVSLDRLAQLLTPLPISSSAMRIAADLWADARRRGKGTAPPERIDFDVILAAQAIQTSSEIVTINVRHMTRYVSSIDWNSI